MPLYAFWLFQAAFAGAAATIVAGGVAERMKFSAYLLYAIVISALVYPTVANQHEEHKYRGASQEIFLFQKIRLEIGVADEKVGEVIEALSLGAKESGGSGLAFVTELFDCVKLGTGTHGDSVL